ncbi:unnamed protein product [Amoebophrya sp. A120]|nr:unnamed protein product [Amoebophrya sp. A120]|eukprot:GSA120T00003292001.1
MGRRARRAAKQAKPRPKLDTQFDCPFCNSAKSVEVKMSRPETLGQLKCRVCGVGYQTRINYLMEPVDVYSEWIDEAAQIAKLRDQKAKNAPSSGAAASSSAVPRRSATEGGGSVTAAKKGDDEELKFILRDDKRISGPEIEDPEF